MKNAVISALIIASVLTAKTYVPILSFVSGEDGRTYITSNRTL